MNNELRQADITRQRVTWVRSGPEWATPSNPLGEHITHPMQYVYTDPDGGEHYFDTRREAAEYAATIWGESS